MPPLSRSRVRSGRSGSRDTSRGFTLIEAMVVVAIIGILAAMTFGALQGVTRRSAAQNASHDLGGALAQARSRAVDRDEEVWVIIYPEGQRGDAAGGTGAYFLYEDPSLGFGLSGGGFDYGDFSPAATTASGATGRLMEATYFDDYSGGTVTFGTPLGATNLALPFASDDAKPGAVGCSFCTSGTGGLRGAVVFSGDGSARFVKGDGTVSAARVAGISVVNVETKQNRLFGIASATGFVGSELR